MSRIGELWCLTVALWVLPFFCAANGAHGLVKGNHTHIEYQYEEGVSTTSDPSN
jgi:hypothetical protein